MKFSDITRIRLVNQQISATKFTRPEEIVSWFGAMQAQVFGMAKWAVALRLKNVNDEMVGEAFNQGKILRIHMLRPTWHFVTPQDIRWMLALTAPRVHAVNAYYYRKFELDRTVFKRANNILVKNLRDGRTLTRTVLNNALRQAKVNADNLRLAYILMQAELDGIICSGPRNGKQFTYALLDERAPLVKPLHPEEQLLEMSKRYFTSRGPATLQDFVWWSGLTSKQASKGIAMLDDGFLHEKIEGQYYVLPANTQKKVSNPRTTFLMPDYDEYGISYKDRNALLDKMNREPVSVYSHYLVVDGIISGTWNLTNDKSPKVEVVPFATVPAAKRKAIDQAAKKYQQFMLK